MLFKISTLFITLLLLQAKVCGQDFKLECKFYFLQNYIKTNHIASIVIYESTDSVAYKKHIKNTVYFDELGRLIKVRDYFFMTDTIAEREILYSYHGQEPYFDTKTYVYLNERGKELKRKAWEITNDPSNHMVIEKFKNGDEIFRKNILTFNNENLLLRRHVTVDEIKYQLNFIYDPSQLMTRSILNIKNPTLKSNANYSLTAYFQYNLNNKIMTSERWIGERDRQLQEFYFIYKGHNISSKVGWSMRDVNGELKKVIERTNFKYNKEGLFIQAYSFKERQVDAADHFTTFEYTYYPHEKAVNQLKVKSDLFVLFMFSNLFEVIQNK